MEIIPTAMSLLFSSCPNLKIVIVPSTVLDVDRCAFDACTQVTKKGGYESYHPKSINHQ